MKTKIFSKIITPRLIIRPVEMADAQAYFDAEQASVKELLPHWSWAKTDKSIEDIKKFINEALEYHQNQHPSEMYFSLLSKKDNKYLGMLWFMEINWFVPNFEIAYWLDTREIGKGYMTEAVNALSKACFKLYGAKRIQIKMSCKNNKSRKIVDKLSFKLEAIMENYFIDFSTNEINDGMLYACCHDNILPTLSIDILTADLDKR